MQSLRVRSTPHNGHLPAASNHCPDEAGLCVQTKPTTDSRLFSPCGKPIRFRLEGRGVSKGFPDRAPPIPVMPPDTGGLHEARRNLPARQAAIDQGLTSRPPLGGHVAFWARALRLVNYRHLVMKQLLVRLLHRLSAIRRAVFALRL